MEKFNWSEQAAAEPSNGNYDSSVVFDVPADGYVMQIIDVEEKTSSKGDKYLVLLLDVAEGPFKDFASKAEDATGNDWSYKKLKAFYHTDKTKAQFRRFLDCLEQSNRKFSVSRWQAKCDERDFKGLLIGVVCDEEFNEYNGSITKRITPNYFKVYNIDDINDGKFQKPRMLTTEQQSLVDNYKQGNNSPAIPTDAIPF